MELRAAYQAAEVRRDRVVLLGIEATSPEQSYGWIEPGTASGASFEVRRFWEKPDPVLAADLMRRGCLWNSFVMVGSIDAFIAAIATALPQLMQAFLAVEASLGTNSERTALDALYRATEPANFSADVLAAQPGRLLVTRARNLGWSDLGEPARVHAAVTAMAPLALQFATGA
jgi:mannose-1-phosphate guanylyltransferase